MAVFWTSKIYGVKNKVTNILKHDNQCHLCRYPISPYCSPIILGFLDNGKKIIIVFFIFLKFEILFGGGHLYLLKNYNIYFISLLSTLISFLISYSMVYFMGGTFIEAIIAGIISGFIVTYFNYKKFLTFFYNSFKIL